MPRVSRLVLRIRSLRLTEANIVLDDPRYWTRTAFEAYLDRCEAVLLEKPTDGLALAELAPPYSRMVSSHSGIQAQALAVLGNAFRACGRIEDSRETYNEIPWSEISGYEEAFGKARLALLHIDLGQFPEALAMVDEAISIFGAIEDKKELAAALVVRGILRIEELGDLQKAILDLSRALVEMNAKLHSRLYCVAIHNLSVAVLFSTQDLDKLSDVTRLLNIARKELRRKRIPKCSVPHAKLRWVSALLMASVGAVRQAERQLVGAREDLVDLRAMTEVAKISLDLGGIYFQEKRWDELAEISVDVIHLDRNFYDSEIFAALLFWRQGILEESLDEKAISFVYEKVYGIKRTPIIKEDQVLEEENFEPIGF